MKLTSEEINSLAVLLASILAKNASKKEIILFKVFLSQVINNLSSYLLD